MRFAYTGIRVRDLERSIDFYTRLMGMKLRKRKPVPETGGEWASLTFPDGGHELELNYYPEGSPFHEPYARGSELDHLAFECDDADAELARLRAAGVRVTVEPFDEGNARLAYIEDPDGVPIELESTRRPAR